MIESGRAQEIVGRFPELRVLVIGDVILDRYVWGSVERISPEAPVPVVRVTRENTTLGGAGNVARNLASLEGQVDLVGVVGEDATARELARLVSDWKIDPRGLIPEPGRPTTVKTRIIAHAQQVVRYDRESDERVRAEHAARLLDGIRDRLPRADGVILQDYGKGVFTSELLDAVMAMLREQDVRVFVDPKAEHWDRYRGAELLKPNLREAEHVARIRVRVDGDLERLGAALLAATGARTLAITRGEAGITLFHARGGVDHVPTVPRRVADPTGAGDTTIATLALARLAGASWLEAAQLANAAAGVVVGVPGTASVTQPELLRAMTAAP